MLRQVTILQDLRLQKRKQNWNKWYSFFNQRISQHFKKWKKDFLKLYLCGNFVTLKKCIGYLKVNKDHFIWPKEVSLLAWYVAVRPCSKCDTVTASSGSFLLCFPVIHCFFHAMGEIFGFMIASQKCCCLRLNMKLIPLLPFFLHCYEKFSGFRKCRTCAAIKNWQKSMHLNEWTHRRIFKGLLNSFTY